MLQIQCPNDDCRKRYPITLHHYGKRVRCKNCKTAFSVSISGSEPLAILEETGSQISDPDRKPRTVTCREFERVGRFEVRDLLGRGAFGAVYLAHDPQLQRDVALKLLQRTGDDKHDSSRIARFLQEGCAAARLQHPHIVPVFDAGQDSESEEYYLAAAYIKGQTLANSIDGQPLDLERAATIVQQLGEALDYAHSKGILHRDVKPDNVMLDQEGTPFLMDFGLARLEESANRMTKDGSLLGTPAYMSPEQLKGRHEALSGASDQYSLGCLLYELLTGRTPFEGPWQTQMHNHLHTPPEPPSKWNSAIPRDLETICLKSVSKAPQERYSSCAEMARDLGRWLSREPIAARPLNRIQRFARWCRREPIVASLTTGVFAIFAVGLSVSLWLWSRAETEKSNAIHARMDLEQANSDLIAARDDARQQAGEAKTQREAAVQERNNARKKEQEVIAAQKETLRQLALNDFDHGVHLCENNDAGKGLLWIARAVSRCPPEAQELEHFFRRNLTAWYASIHTLQSDLTLTPFADAVFSPALNHDGSVIIAQTAASRLQLWNTQLGNPSSSIDSSRGPFRFVELSPDGRILLAAAADGSVSCWDATSGKLFVENLTEYGPVSLGKVSRNGKTAAIVVSNSFQRIDLRSGMKVGLGSLLDSQVLAIDIASDGETVVTGDEDSQVIIWYPTTSGKPPKILKHDGPVRSVAFSPDDSMILSGSDDKTARLWKTSSGEVLCDPLLHASTVNAVCFSGNGTVIGTESTHTPMFNNMREGKPNFGFQITFAPYVQLWVTSTGQALTDPIGGSIKGRYSTFALRPDGFGLLMGRSLSMDGAFDETQTATSTSATLIDLQTGSQIGQPLQHSRSVFQPCFSADGQVILTTAMPMVLSEDAEVSLRVWSHTKPLKSPLAPWEMRPGNLSSTNVRLSSKGDFAIASYEELHPKYTRIWEVGAATEMEFHRMSSPDRYAYVVSEDGERVAYAENEKLFLRDIGSKTTPNNPILLPDSIQKIAAAENPNHLLVACQNGTVFYVDVPQRSKTEVSTARENDLLVTALAISDDSRLAVIGRGNAELRGSIEVWDLLTMKPKFETLKLTDFGSDELQFIINAVDFSPDNRFFVTRSRVCALWDASTGELCGTPLKCDFIHAPLFTQDGSLLVFSAHNWVELYDIESRNETGRRFNHGAKVTAAALDSTETLLATGGADGSLKLWDFNTGKRIGPNLWQQATNSDQIMSIDFDFDGNTLVTGSRGMPPCVWRIPEPSPWGTEKLRSWTEMVTGYSLDEENMVHVLSSKEWKERQLDFFTATLERPYGASGSN